MEEFQESDILWPELEDGQQERSTEFDESSATTRARPGISAPILIPSKGLSHSWTAGINYGGNAIDLNDDDDGDDYVGADAAGNTSGRMVPPHILVSRKHARNMPFSVCIGNGRKLKGREQMAARISVLRLTGFVEK